MAKHARFFIASGIFLFLAIVCGTILAIFYTVPTFVQGKSMEPTLDDGQFVIVNKLDQDIAFGDIVMFKRVASSGQESFYINRVLGVPGDTLEVFEDRIIRNDSLLKEPYTSCEQEEVDQCTKGGYERTIHIEDNYYFVAGDNREHSLDSRQCFQTMGEGCEVDSNFGLVHSIDMVGAVISF